MLALYAADVIDRRQNHGRQGGNAPAYAHPGVGLLNPNGTHKVGNCADWQHPTWSALVVHKWKCWKEPKIPHVSTGRSSACASRAST